MTYRDPRGWPFDEQAPRPPGAMVIEGEALDALIAYWRRWKPENERIERERRQRRGGRR